MKNIDWKPLALVGLLSSGLTLGGAYFLQQDNNRSVVLQDASPRSALATLAGLPSGVPSDFVAAAEKTTSAVVHIKVKVTQKATKRQLSIEDLFGGDPFGGGQRQNPRQEGSGSGSGVIISADGYIVTNNHVVGEASEIEVIMDDKRTFKAKLIGTDPNTDIAVIQLVGDKIPTNLPTLAFSNSDDIKVGEWVLAVGNPFSLESTVTAGIVSAKGRNIGIIGENDKASNPIESFIQTDAVVNPGNSGGALVNLKGELVGINTAIAGGMTGTYVGYSFAVPANLVKKVAGDLLKYGNVQRGFLGITKMEEVTNEVAERRDLKVNSGIYFGDFGENSAAKAAGLKIGDIIVKIDGKEVKTLQRLVELVGQRKPGDVVVITANRDGVLKDFNVTLKNSSGTTGILKNDPASASVVSDALGAKLGNISASEKSKFKINGGAKILEIAPDGWLDYQEVPEGYIITKIDDTAVTDAKQASDIFAKKEGRVRMELLDPASGQSWRVQGIMR